MGDSELIRSRVVHTPANPFLAGDAVQAFEDGGLLVHHGRIAACGDFAALRAAFPAAPVTDWRDGLVLPGFIDTHIHFPQLRVVGHLGRPLLEWLDAVALPEEARMADVTYATAVAADVARALAGHGTTTASVFGAHYAPAVAAFFDAARTSGLRVDTGLVMADRGLRPDLLTSPRDAHAAATALIARFHGRAGLRYSVTPRFALSATEAMLEVCQSLMAEHPDVRAQTHLNESPAEIAEVGRLFPWAGDYLEVYERFGLEGPRTILAHDVHVTNAELVRLARSRTPVAHCPSSNAALGSGIFPLQRHLRAGVRVALGTDVGAGTGPGMLKEGLQASLMQRVAPEPAVVTPAQVLYLATRAGAEAMALDGETGDFSAGKSADFVYLRPPDASVLAEVVERAGDVMDVLAGMITLAGAESVRETRVAGRIIHRALGEP